MVTTTTSMAMGSSRRAPPAVKSTQRNTAPAQPFPPQQIRDQETGNNEEDVDPHVATA